MIFLLTPGHDLSISALKRQYSGAVENPVYALSSMWIGKFLRILERVPECMDRIRGRRRFDPLCAVWIPGAVRSPGQTFRQAGTARRLSAASLDRNRRSKRRAISGEQACFDPGVGVSAREDGNYRRV